MSNITVNIKKLDNFLGLSIPSYATLGSAGVDLSAAIREDLVLTPLQRILVPTGISISLPEGYEAQVRPRSGLALKNGITVLNSPGTIDSDYTGEIGVILINLGQEEFVISRGMRIAQMIVAKVEQAFFKETDELVGTSRGNAGFGSTGIKEIVS